MLKQLEIAALVIAGAAFMAPSEAQTATFRINAAGSCQGALPVYATNLRFRPTALKNEGTSSSYVSCSLGSLESAVHTNVLIWFGNASAVTAEVGCTIVTGNVQQGLIWYTATPVTIAPGGAGSISQDFDELIDTAAQVNMSCLLPKGVELQYIRQTEEDAPA